MKQIIILIAILMGVACYAPTSTCYGQPGETGFGRLEVFGPPGRSQQAPAPANPLVDSLVAYYGLEEASGTRYDGHGTNHLTAYNNPGDTVGVIGRAATFDNVIGQYLGTTANDLSAHNESFTCMWWDYAYDPTNPSVRVSINQGVGLTGVTSERVGFSQNANHVTRILEGTNIKQIAWSNQTAVTWRHNVLVFDRNNDTAYYYGNNVLIGRAYISGSVNIQNSFTIGTALSSSYAWFGVIDEVYFWRGYSAPHSFISWYYNNGAGRTYSELISYSP